ncbi:hypothetical protein Ccrd_007398 [Cynara cardunculus var. scolymus]|uniref:Digalactosyldiacylglycerol synthase n=1 Tax=Cynara cardunculus var. scolymus TaxID=59895 RepID=A0A103XH59_CYNCS|nr:hypothetical protein Ccrd_007398 [Cynara cardunculus var. scolymus]
MINFRPAEALPSSTETTSSSAVAAEKAISFISKGWREVKDSTEADLRLMKDRAESFKNLASSFDREFENFLNSASKSSFPVLVTSSSPSPAEIDFMRRWQPKISDISRTYSSPDFSRRVLKKWRPRANIRIDLSAIKNAIVSEVEFDDREAYQRRARTRVNNFSWELEGEGDQGQLLGHWERIRAFKTRLGELEKRSSSSEIIEGLKNSRFVVKVKSSLKAICKEPDNLKDVPPLDIPELLAYLVKQSVPFLDHFGVKRDVSDKIVESLFGKRKNQLLLRSFHPREPSIPEGDNVIDELDSRVASVLQSTGHHYEGGLWTNLGKHQISDSDGKRHVAIVTTASLPWMTGTAVNPLFRAAYLAKSKKQSITLLVPWLTRGDQELVYPNNITFSSPAEQEAYIRSWLEERRRSIIPAGDTSKFIPSKDADIAILEEPEHLNWYHHGKRWTSKFNHVVGVVHTNYLEYIKREKYGALQAFFVKHINNLVTRAYCDKVLRLSAATQDLPKSVICNVHGVNPKFLTVGERMAAEREGGQNSFSKGAYFLGKMVWAKGYRELIDLLAKQKDDLNGFRLDVYGNGEDAHEVQTTASSVSDVLCTATAEALAMGKFVVCADHPSNEFFTSFPNCLTYKTPQEFVNKVKEAMENEPHPLTGEQQYKLSWEAATERFMEYSELEKILVNDSEKSRSKWVDGGLAFGHYCFTGNEVLRLCTGAVPGTRNYDKEQCNDLNLVPPQVENPIYGWQLVEAEAAVMMSRAATVTMTKKRVLGARC